MNSLISWIRYCFPFEYTPICLAEIGQVSYITVFVPDLKHRGGYDKKILA